MATPATFGQPGQQRRQQPYGNAPIHDYTQHPGPQHGYGAPHPAAYGVLQYAPPSAYLPVGMQSTGDDSYEAEALALAQGMNNMVLGPGQLQMVPLQAQFYAPQQAPAAYGPAGYAYPHQGPQGVMHASQHPGQRAMQQQQQQHYHHHHHQHPGMPMNGPHMEARGPVQNGRVGPRLGRGMGPQGTQQQQQQRGGRKKVQKGLEDNVRRTVYISYIEQQVTEESLATFFANCGTVMDCRICGDPNSAMRFAFIEFMEEAGAQEALKMTGSTLGTSSLRVLPSKTAIVPVNKELMPRSEEELERCSRTVYVANIDKKVEREDVRAFFEKLCGRIGKIRLLGDLQHSTRIAFIEFVEAEAAMEALNCSGALLGALPLRVSPSKTPVRGDKEDRDIRQGRAQKAQRNAASGNHHQQVQQAAPSATGPESAPSVGAASADGDEQQGPWGAPAADGSAGSDAGQQGTDAAVADDSAAVSSAASYSDATAEPAGVAAPEETSADVGS